MCTVLVLEYFSILQYLWTINLIVVRIFGTIDNSIPSFDWIATLGISIVDIFFYWFILWWLNCFLFWPHFACFLKIYLNNKYHITKYIIYIFTFLKLLSVSMYLPAYFKLYTYVYTLIVICILYIHTFLI